MPIIFEPSLLIVEKPLTFENLDISVQNDSCIVMCKALTEKYKEKGCKVHHEYIIKISVENNNEIPLRFKVIDQCCSEFFNTEVNS